MLQTIVSHCNIDLFPCVLKYQVSCLQHILNVYFQDLQADEGEQETESEVEEEQEQEKTLQRRVGRKAQVEIEYEQEREPKRTRLKA